MDELTLLRRLRDDIDGVDRPRADLERVRQQLLNTIASDSVVRASTRRRWPAVVAAGLLLATGGTATYMLGPEPLSPSAAASTLDRASVREATGSVRVPSGSYLKVEHRSQQIGPAPGNYSGEATAPSRVALSRLRSTVYVPADPSQQWISITDCAQRTQPLDPAALNVPLIWSVEQGPGHLCPIRDEAPGGGFGSSRGEDFLHPSVSFLASLPRDPSALLQRVRDDYHPNPRDPKNTASYDAWRKLSALLDSVIAGPDLRAATLRAMALMPDTRIIPATAPDGRPARAVTVAADDGPYADSVLIDSATGELMGTATVLVAEHAGMGAGTTVSTDQVTRSVVTAGPVPEVSVRRPASVPGR